MRLATLALLVSTSLFGACRCAAPIEDCQNTFDDDADGFVDCQDEDCQNVLFCATSCGDGALDEGEECDNGAANSDTTPDACRVSCQSPRCGDNVVDSGEQCDDGNKIFTDGCHLCAIVTQETCGDGVLNAEEQCDDGAANSDTAPDACRTNCLSPRCGDFVVDSGESCDDGNNDPSDGCDDCSEKLNTCGDGVVEPPELCDDGNLIDGDGCSSLCEVEPCGDGFLDNNEECDDGNKTDGDGCQANCTTLCGDGFEMPGEVCVSAQLLPTNPDPFGLVLSDFDNDQDLDLAVALNLSNQVWLYQNNAGQMTPSLILQLEADTFPGGIAAADLEGDGDQDLIVTESNISRVRLVENVGGGSFTIGQALFGGVNPDSGLVARDLNGDGLVDIAAVNTDSQNSAPQDTISVFFSLGGLSFTEDTTINVGETPFALVAIDLVGDGLPELISGNLDEQSISIAPNAGVFGASVSLPMGSAVTGLFVTDIDGDLDQDLLASRFELNEVSILENQGGTLALQQSFSTVSPGPVGVVAGDLNGDGLLDIATANFLDDDVSVLYGQAGGFVFARRVETDLGPEPLVVGDLNGDGRADLVVGNRFANSVSVLLSAPF